MIEKLILTDVWVVLTTSTPNVGAKTKKVSTI